MNIILSEALDRYPAEPIDMPPCPNMDLDRVKARVLAQVETSGPEKTHRPWLKTLLVAAAAVLCLSVAAVAAYQYRLKDAVVEPSPIPTETQSETPAPPVQSERLRLSLNGFTDSPEYKAWLEWDQWLDAWRAENGNRWNELGIDDSVYETNKAYAHLYGAYFNDQAEKLEELLAEYGLRAHEDRFDIEHVAQVEDFLGLEGLLGEELADRHGGGYIYDDGSFKLELDMDDSENGFRWCTMFHAVKGSFSMISAHFPADYEETAVTDAHGFDIIYALGEEKALAIVSLDNAYLTLSLSEPEGPEELEWLVNSLDLTALNKAFSTAYQRELVTANIYTFQNRERSTQTPEMMTKATELVMGLLGNYYLAGLPEGSYIDRSYGYLPEEHGSSGCFELQHTYVVPSKSGGQQELSFSFHSPNEEELRSGQPEMLDFGGSRFDSQVQGFPALGDVFNQGDGFALTWWDTEKNLIFRFISFGGFSREEVESFAESVTAADPALDMSAEALAGRIAEHQEAIDAYEAATWAEFYAMEAEYLAAQQAVFDELGVWSPQSEWEGYEQGDYETVSLRQTGITVLDDGSIWPANGESPWTLRVRRFFYRHAADPVTGSYANLTFMYSRTWLDEGKTRDVTGERFQINRSRPENEACTVGEHEGYWDNTESDGGIERGPMLVWYDKENNLIFSLTAEKLADQEALLTFAESVAPVE